MVAEIIPLARLPKNLNFFDYEVPQNIGGQIKIGQMARISFRGKKVFGIVTNLKKEPVEMKAAIKQLDKIIVEEPILDKVRLKLMQVLADYYLVSPALVLKTFIPEPPLRFVATKIEKKYSDKPLSVVKSDIPKIQESLGKILLDLKNFFLLKYRNQKNKTAILLKIAEKIVGVGKGVLILEPQIPDLEGIASYFLHSMPGKVAFLHGGLSKTEYWREWQKIKDGQAKIVIGTRSAVFVPLPNLGLIVVDNEEAPDFKQSDQNPRYDSRFAVRELARLTGARLIFTSQAPRPETYFLANERMDAATIDLDGTVCPVVVTDMNEETKNKNFSALSIKMREKISSALEARKKTILLLNRRGAATLLVCRDCGYAFKCENCGASLICHETHCNLPGKFVCHSCGKEEAVRLLCPNCRGTSIKYSGVGTQTVEEEIKKFFPKARVLRIDQDAKIKASAVPEADIFIGTQFFIRNYLSKIKDIDFLGIVSADTLIYRPDFRSGEKTFSWLTGLINYGQQEKSAVMIQTFFPNNFVIQSAADGNYELFYKKEIEERESMGYPPFGKLIKLSYTHPNEKKCFYESDAIFKKLNSSFPEAEFFRDEKPKKEKQKFSTKIIIKFKESVDDKLMNFLKTTPDDWTIDIDPESLL